LAESWMQFFHLSREIFVRVPRVSSTPTSTIVPRKRCVHVPHQCRYEVLTSSPDAGTTTAKLVKWCTETACMLSTVERDVAPLRVQQKRTKPIMEHHYIALCCQHALLLTTVSLCSSKPCCSTTSRQWTTLYRWHN